MLSLTDKLELILQTVCEQLSVKVEEVKGAKRKRELVMARQMYCTIAKRNVVTEKRNSLSCLHQVPLNDISELIGARHHSSVIHSIRTCLDHCDMEPEFLAKLEKAEMLAMAKIELDGKTGRIPAIVVPFEVRGLQFWQTGARSSLKIAKKAIIK